jgi:UDP-glucose-4-epimerase GalE
MRVLVTGGAGYIGSHAVRELARAGHEVVILDNLSTGFERLSRGFRLVVADMGDTAAVAPVLRDVDAVMHFAAHAYVGEGAKQPRKYFENNVQSGLRFLHAMLDAGIRTLIFSSSCTLYGATCRVPISEDVPRNPVNVYGYTKLLFEHALEAYAAADGLRFVSLRYFNAAGADTSGEIGEMHDPETHLIPIALDVAAGLRPALEIYGDDYPTPDGTCIRDYVHVTDLGRAHALALEHLAGGGASEFLNLGTGRGYSVKEIVAAIERVTGRRILTRLAARRAGDPPALVADASKARQLLGWAPAFTLDDIVATAWRWRCIQNSGHMDRPLGSAVSSGSS